MTTITAIEVLYEDAIDEVAIELRNLNQAKPKHDPEKCGCEFIAFGLWSCGHYDGQEE